MVPGEEIALRIDQTLTQDATGTLVMQELEALGVRRTRAQISVRYVDHACRRLRHLVLQTGQRCFASDAHAAVRGAGRDAGRFRLAHVRGGFAGHAGCRCRRVGGRAGDRGAAVVVADAGDLGCATDRRVAAVGVGQGCYPGDVATARCSGVDCTGSSSITAWVAVADRDGSAWY